MLYHVSRNGQTYGPYTLEDLQRYLASGNVLPTDLARSESMSEWLPVAQILGGATSTFPQPPIPTSAYASYPVAAVNAYPDPPNLHWAVLLLLEIFTCSLFRFVWNLVIAHWLKRVQPHSKAYIYYWLAVAFMLMETGASSHSGMLFHPGMHPYWPNHVFHPWNGLIALSGFIVRLIARFFMRSELEEHFNVAEPVGLSLSGVMTFFFGGLYFQYHLNRINERKRMARYAAPTLR
ncbi:MAG TPA: DUF4339 domain-containing protein [Acidobacteriaceae bacterium]|nr:DUF4339 domain-containing protein [Acidobacteriaceae bacterium]